MTSTWFAVYEASYEIPMARAYEAILVPAWAGTVDAGEQLATVRA